MEGLKNEEQHMQLNIAEINIQLQIIFRTNSLNNSLSPPEHGLRSG